LQMLRIRLLSFFVQQGTEINLEIRIHHTLMKQIVQYAFVSGSHRPRRMRTMGKLDKFLGRQMAKLSDDIIQYSEFHIRKLIVLKSLSRRDVYPALFVWVRPYIISEHVLLRRTQINE